MRMPKVKFEKKLKGGSFLKNGEYNAIECGKFGSPEVEESKYCQFRSIV